MCARTVNIGTGERKLGDRLDVGRGGSVVEEFREFVLNWIFHVENEDGVGVEGDFLGLPGIIGF